MHECMTFCAVQISLPRRAAMSVPTHISDPESNVPHLEQEDVARTTARELHLVDHPLGQPLKGRSRMSVSQRTTLNPDHNPPLRRPVAHSASPHIATPLELFGSPSTELAVPPQVAVRNPEADRFGSPETRTTGTIISPFRRPERPTNVHQPVPVSVSFLYKHSVESPSGVYGHWNNITPHERLDTSEVLKRDNRRWGMIRREDGSWQLLPRYLVLGDFAVLGEVHGNRGEITVYDNPTRYKLLGKIICRRLALFAGSLVLAYVCFRVALIDRVTPKWKITLSMLGGIVALGYTFVLSRLLFTRFLEWAYGPGVSVYLSVGSTAEVV